MSRTNAIDINESFIISDLLFMALKVSIVSLLLNSTEVTMEGMESTGKRTVQVNVKMSADDFSALQRAANTL